MGLDRYIWRIVAPWINILCAALMLGLAIYEQTGPNPELVVIILYVVAAGFNIFAAWNWWRN